MKQHYFQMAPEAREVPMDGYGEFSTLLYNLGLISSWPEVDI